MELLLPVHACSHTRVPSRVPHQGLADLLTSQTELTSGGGISGVHLTKRDQGQPAGRRNSPESVGWRRGLAYPGLNQGVLLPFPGPLSFVLSALLQGASLSPSAGQAR